MGKPERLWEGDVLAVQVVKLNAFPPSPLNKTLLHTYVYMYGTCYIQLLHTMTSNPIIIQCITMSITSTSEISNSVCTCMSTTICFFKTLINVWTD